MPKIIYLVVFFFLFTLAKAQDKTDPVLLRQYNILEKISQLKNDSIKIKTIDSLLASGKITQDKYIAGLYSLRADVLADIYDVQINDYISFEGEDSLKSDSSVLIIINTIIQDYTKAIEACTFCSPMYKEKRMDFYSTIGNDSLYEKDLEDMKKCGYKPHYDCPAELGFNYIKGKNDWVGMEISATSLFQRGYYLKNIDPLTGKRKKVDDYSVPVGASILTLGYSQNLNIKAHEFTLSLVRITAPVFISVTKFGALQNAEQKKLVWFYRPEIGIGNSFISIGYAYNLVFKKSERNNWEKHLFVLKVIIPTIKL